MFPEFSRWLGFDSQDMKPNLDEYRKIPIVNAWLDAEPEKRFKTEAVLEAITISEGAIDATVSAVVGQNKRTWCDEVKHDILTRGRDADIYTLLEHSKENVLAAVLQNEKPRNRVVKSGAKTLDQIVTLQVIGLFFDFFENGSKPRPDREFKNRLRGKSLN